MSVVIKLYVYENIYLSIHSSFLHIFPLWIVDYLHLDLNWKELLDSLSGEEVVVIELW